MSDRLKLALLIHLIVSVVVGALLFVIPGRSLAVLKLVPIAILGTLLWLSLAADRGRLRRHGDLYRTYMRRTPLLIPRIPSSAAILQTFRRRTRH